ncbi:MAG: MFS transporter [Candidatus Methanofastidiosia archaeon]
MAGTKRLGHIAFLKKYRNVLLICLAIFMSMVGFGMIFPLFPTLAATFETSKTEIGLVASMFALTRTMLVRPFGALSDKIGRKPMLVSGFIGYGIFMSSFAFATNIYWLYVLRAAQGVASAAVWPAASALIADSVEAEDRGKAMGYLGMSTSVGMIFGPAFGGFLKDIYGIQIPFLLCGIITGAMAPLIKFSIKETVSFKEKQKILKKKKFSFSLRKSIFWIKNDYNEIKNSRFASTLFGMMLAGFIFNFAFALIEPLLPLFADEKVGATATQVGLAFALAGVVGTIVRPLAGELTDRIGRRKPILFGTFYAGILTIPMSFIVTPLQMIYVLGIRSVGWAISDPATLALLTDASDEDKRGKIFGLYQFSTGLGWMIGPIFGGILYDLKGGEFSFLMTAIGTLIAGILLTITIKETKKGGD